MSDIDQLSIQISADATKAEKAIDGLVTKLRSLNNALDLGNIGNFKRQLNEISQSAKGVKDVSAAINSLAKAGTELSKLTGFHTLSDQLKTVEQESKKSAEGIANAFKFNKDAKGYKNNIAVITDLYRQYFDVLRNGQPQNATMFSSQENWLKALEMSLSDIISKLARYEDETAVAKDAVAEFARSTKVYIDDSTRSWLENADKLQSVMSIFKDVSFDRADGYSDISGLIGEFKKVGVDLDGVEGDITEIFTRIIDRVQNGSSEVAQAFIRSKEAISRGIESQANIDQYAKDALSRIQELYNQFQNGEAKNPFAGIISGVQSLQGITIPDFSGLQTLATGLNALKDVNPKKIQDIGNAVKAFGESGNISFNIGGADAVKDYSAIQQAVETVSTKITNIADGFSAFLQNAESVGATIQTWAVVFEAIVESLGAIQSELAGIRETVNSMPELFSGSNNAEMSGQLLQAIGAFGELIKYADEAKQSIQGLSSAVDGLTGNIGNLPVKDQIKDVGDKAAESKEKVKGFEESIRELFASGYVQDNVSAKMAGILNSINETQDAISAMYKHTEIFDVSSLERFRRELNESKRELDNFERALSRKIRVGTGLDESSQEAQKLRDRIEDIRQAMSDMDNGKIGINVAQYQAWEKELEKISARYDELMGKKKEVEKPSNIDLLANLVAFGHELQHITSTLGNIGDYLFKGLKIAFKPMDWLIAEHKERIEGIGEAFKKMADKAKSHLNRLSAFWKRVMKTFTFMLVRKAITAVLGEVSDAIKSLALWSKQFGTIFNDSVSQITSNFSFIARGIVGMVEPIINALVPAFNALSYAITNLTAKIGEFFAALTGQGYYMVAKRQVTDYAESVEKAQKAQKNLIAGLDDLNIITTPTSTASGMDDVAEQWDKIDVSEKMKDFADDVKDLAEKLFKPIKDAWDEAGDHVKKGFKYMLDEIGKLAKDIGRDFMIVWQEPETTGIFEDLLHTIGYIEEGIGNIAKRFREAWNEGSKGLHILEHIRDLVKIVSGHVKEMAKTFAEWADNLNFNKLLASFDKLLVALQPFVDFLMNVLAYIWENVILRHWKFQIEEGLPHLMETISKVLDAFNFDKILEDIKPVIDAFETLRENIDIGLTNAFGNLGLALADFANSDEFTKFCETVAWLMDQVTAERVEKLFTALGLAIGQVAGNLIKFVNSDKFRDFVQLLMDWYDSKSAEEIADILVKIAKAIAMFKFAQFAGEGVMKFMEVLTMFKALSTMSGGGGLLSGLLGGGGGGLLGSLAPALAILAGIAAAVYSIYESFGGWNGVLDEINIHVTRIREHFDKMMKESGLGDAIDNMIQKIKELGESLGGWESVWQAVFTIIEGVIVFCEDLGIPVIKAFIDMISGIAEVISGVVDVVGGVFDILKGIFTLDGNALIEGAKKIGEGIFGAFKGLADLLLAPFKFIGDLVKGIFDFFAWLKEVLLGDPIVIDICDGIFGAFSGMVELVAGVVGWLVNAIAGFFGAIFDTVSSIVGGIADFLSGAWNGIKDVAVSVWNGISNFISGCWEGIKTGISTAAGWIGDRLSDAWNGMKSVAETVWGGIQTGIQWAWDGITNICGRAADGLAGLLQGAWNTIVGAAQSAWGTIKGLVSSAWSGIKELASSAWDAATDLAGNIWNGATGLAKGAWDWGVDMVSGFADGVKDTVGDVVDAVGDFTNWIWKNLHHSTPDDGALKDDDKWMPDMMKLFADGIDDNAYRVEDAISEMAVRVVDILQQMSDASCDVVDTAIKLISDIVRGGIAENISHVNEAGMMVNTIMSAILKTVESGMGSLNNMLTNCANMVANAMASIKVSVMNTMNEIGMFMNQSGGNITRGLENGINESANRISRTMSSLAASVTTGFAVALGIHSPSKVFENFGEMIVEGLNVGIDENADSTEKSLNSWFKDIVDYSVPQFDISNAIPKSSLQMDAYTHGDFTGTAAVDSTAIQQSVRQGVMDAIGGLILPYLSDIAESSRETASKELTISDRAIGTAASRYARDFQTRTGRPAFGY